MTRQELLNRRLKLYVEAEERILQGQSYQIGDRTLTRANLASVRKVIDDLLLQGATLDENETFRSPSYIKRVLFYDH